MSDSGQAWGMCSAYGCPLLGTLGSGGQWWCFCHHEQPPSANAAITLALRERFSTICRLTIALRGRDEEAIRLSRQELRGHPNGHDLAFRADADKNAYGWLLRLERFLIEQTSALGRGAPAHRDPIGGVIGPTHVSGYMPDKERREDANEVVA